MSHETIEVTWLLAATKCVWTNRPPFALAIFRCPRV